ncbi:MAG TPA: DMT family transporter [Saliniramus sp.]|nr:DMT family transporter [Saliniramus sp.]
MTDAQTVTDAKPVVPPHQRPFDATALGLYAAVVFSWGFSWIAMRGQLGVVEPEVSVLWRFVIAGAVMWLWVGLKRERMRFEPRTHLFFLGVGVFMFSSNFVLFYYGGLTIPSGLLAVVFSLASIGNLLMAALFLGQPIGLRVGIGGLIGAVGIGLLYLPEIMAADFSPAVLTGLALCVLGTLSFCAGNIVSGKLQQRGIALLPTIAWGMTYSVVFLFLVSLARGHDFIIEPNARYLGSLVFLAIVSSVVAFAAYIGLLRRIGAARAGYATVIFPIVALSVSTMFEGYSWTPLAALGAAFALAGNLVVLRTPRR